MCGGFANCGTCHVHVEEAWLDKLPPVAVEEDIMLEGTMCPRQPNSRLACQLQVSKGLDGLFLHTPESQI